MLTKEAIYDVLTSFMRGFSKLKDGERIAGLQIIVRTKRRVWMLQRTKFFKPLGQNSFVLNVHELAEKIYQEQLDFALTQRNVIFLQSAVRLPKHLAEIAPSKIKADINSKLGGTLEKRRIFYLADAMCFTEREFKTILNVENTNEIVRQLSSRKINAGILRNPKTQVEPKSHSNDTIEIDCQFLVA